MLEPYLPGCLILAGFAAFVYPCRGLYTVTRVFGKMNAHTVPTISVTLEPQGKTLDMPRLKTVRQLLQKLALRQGTVLVIRDGGLLTHDREIRPGDAITIRTVVSSG